MIFDRQQRNITDGYAEMAGLTYRMNQGFQNAKSSLSDFEKALKHAALVNEVVDVTFEEVKT